jgi:hypothetical protein
MVSKKFLKNYQKFSANHTIFCVPFGVFRREIAGNGHSRLLKFKIFRGSMPLEMWVLEQD